MVYLDNLDENGISIERLPFRNDNYNGQVNPRICETKLKISPIFMNLLQLCVCTCICILNIYICKEMTWYKLGSLWSCFVLV